VTDDRTTIPGESQESQAPGQPHLPGRSRDQDSATGQGRPPWLLGVIAVALMVGGYQLLNYAPPRRDTEQVRLLEDLKSKAADDPVLSERLREIEVPSTRPYRAAGTIAIYGGLLLFIAAGIKMYHHRPPPAENDGPEDPES
jgi:hypothetical protein